MQRIELTEDLSFSRIIHGMWRLAEWDMSPQERLAFIEQCIELGITTFNHADIYGGYTCEGLFGEALRLKPSLRDQIEIVTKTGIKLTGSFNPGQSINHYDTTKEHIIRQAERSLQELAIDQIDTLLIHRPTRSWTRTKSPKRSSRCNELEKCVRSVSRTTYQRPNSCCSHVYRSNS